MIQLRTTAFNADFLGLFLKEMDTDRVTMRFGTAANAMLLETPGHAEERLLMPIRLD